jgi:hypothetical protein
MAPRHWCDIRRELVLVSRELFECQFHPSVAFFDTDSCNRRHTAVSFLACKRMGVASERRIMTKNIGMLLLAIYLILVGITTLFHVGIGAIVMGVLALVTGVLILVGK